MVARKLTVLLFVAMLALSVAAPGAFAGKGHGNHKPPPRHHHVSMVH